MKMSRRILSVVLAAALLITCGITGLVLPVSAASGNLIINSGFDNGDGENEGIVSGNESYVAMGNGKDGSWGATRDAGTTSQAATAKIFLQAASKGHVTEDMQTNTVYVLKFDYEESVGGTTQVYFYGAHGTAVASSLSSITRGTQMGGTTSTSATSYTLSEGGTNGWQSGYIVFESPASTAATSYITFRRYKHNSNTLATKLRIDNVELHKVDLSVAPSVKNGTINLSTAGSPDPAAWVLDASEGTDVTVQVTPKDGYMMVPGSLKYTTAGNSNGVNILNKAESGFGDGAGDQFTFTMPAEPAQVTAEFVQVADGDYRMDSIGTSVHYTGGQADGIRFLTRLNVAGEFDATADTLTLGGKEVAEIGTLLKRGTATKDDMELADYDNYKSQSGEGKMWKAVNYSKEAGTYKVNDYTDSYLDFATVMMTSVTDRKFTAVGYITFADGTTVYGDSVQVDDIASAEARM